MKKFIPVPESFFFAPERRRVVQQVKVINNGDHVAGHSVYQHEQGETHRDKTKQAFMAAMEEFSNSPAFQALTYRLENNFNIQIHHSIYLRMNT
jgi:hypothetical protein